MICSLCAEACSREITPSITNVNYFFARQTRSYDCKRSRDGFRTPGVATPTLSEIILRLYPTRINECLDRQGPDALFFGLADCHHDNFCASSSFFNRVNPGLARLALLLPIFFETGVLRHCLSVLETRSVGVALCALRASRRICLAQHRCGASGPWHRHVDGTRQPHLGDHDRLGRGSEHTRRESVQSQVAHRRNGHRRHRSSRPLHRVSSAAPSVLSDAGALDGALRRHCHFCQ